MTILAVLFLVACCGIQKNPALVNCETAGIQKVVTSVSPAIIAVLDHQSSIAAAALDSLAPVGLDAVMCGVEAIVTGMESGKSMAVPPTSQVQVLTSGRSYLAAKGRRRL